jgi:hypothetical protein
VPDAETATSALVARSAFLIKRSVLVIIIPPSLMLESWWIARNALGATIISKVRLTGMCAAKWHRIHGSNHLHPHSP